MVVPLLARANVPVVPVHAVVPLVPAEVALTVTIPDKPAKVE
jgi:hypothetical protein